MTQTRICMRAPHLVTVSIFPLTISWLPTIGATIARLGTCEIPILRAVFNIIFGNLQSPGSTILALLHLKAGLSWQSN